MTVAVWSVTHRYNHQYMQIQFNQPRPLPPSFSPSRCVNIRHYTTQAAVSVIRCATHQ